jgi:hypothetical protein
VAARVLSDELHEACGAGLDWRPTPTEALGVWGQAQDLVAGTPGVLRALRASAAEWATDGSLAVGALGDGPTCSALVAHRQALARARVAVAAVLADG